jgi:hypothetical protein
MRERGQASVETIALTAAALALATALIVGVAGLAPWLASGLEESLSGVLAPAAPHAPGLDGFERTLLAAATSPAADAPTLLDLRTRLRARLDRPAADAAFAATLRPLVARALEAKSITSKPGAMVVTDREDEAAWIRHRFHPSESGRIVQTAASLAGTPGAVYSVISDLGMTADEPADGIAAGFEAGDVIVRVRGGGYREVVLRRRPDSGLRVVLAVLANGGPEYAQGASTDTVIPGGAVPVGPDASRGLRTDAP